MTKVTLVEQLVDRERGREQVQGVQAFPGRAELAGEGITAPQLWLEVGVELVVDDQLRGRQRVQPLVQVVEIVVSGQIRNWIVPPLQWHKIRVHHFASPRQVKDQIR